VAGLGLVLLILSPYLVYEVQHDWPNLRASVAMTTLPSITDLKALHMAALSTGGYHLEDLAGERHTEFVNSIVDLRWLDTMEMGLLWIGIAWLIWRLGRGLLRRHGRLLGRNAARVVLIAWFALPLLLLLRHSVDMFPHTVQVLYPSQHLIIALLLADVAAFARLGWGRRAGQFVGTSGMVLVVILAGWHVYLQESLLCFVDANDTPGGFGAPLRDTLAAVRQAERLSEEAGGAEILALVPGDDVRYDSDAAVFSVLLPQDARLVDGRQALLFPVRPAIYAAVPGAAPGVGMLQEFATELYPALPVRTGSEATYRFFRGTAGEILPAYRPNDTPVRWASGATLLGYDWSGEWALGNTARWKLYLRVEGEPLKTEIHWFNQLIDEDGHQWAQMDAAGFPTSSWRQSDTILLWFDIAISPDASPPPYFMRTGAYFYPEITNVQLLDVAGNPAGEFAILGPLGATP
jgi:hypothetical protein